MEARDKKILVQSVSAVLIIVVLFNVYSGITVSKIGIPGLMEIEFNTGDKQPETTDEPFNPKPIDESSNPDQGGAITTHTNVDGGSASAGKVGQHTQSDSPPIQPAQRQIDLNGLWYGADGSEYEISHSDGMVYFTEYGLFGVTAEGTGSIQNGRLVLNYQTVLGTSGRATFDISPNGQVISGVADDFTSGVSTPLYLTRY